MVSRPEAPAALPLHVVPRTLAVHWVLVGIAMAATIVVLLVKVLAGGSSHAAEDPGVAGSAVLTPPVAAAPASSLVDAGIGQDATATIKTVNDAPPAKSAPGKPVQRKSVPRADAASVVVAAPSPAPDPAPAAYAPAPPSRAAEAPRPDPWQAMNDGLSRCAREDLFSRAACEQRLRLQYCPNYWGLVAQCPIGPGTDHGQ
jgi:hypothetical protein